MWMSASALFFSSFLPAVPVEVPSKPQVPESEVRFATKRTTLWAGRSAVLTFAHSSTADSDLELPVTVSDADIVRALGLAVVLAGRDTGSLRLRAMAEGNATVQVGNALIEIEVQALPAEARLMRGEPDIVAPAEGAVVWGTFALACELTSSLGRDDLRIALDLPNGRRLAALPGTEHVEGPLHRAVFEVDADQLKTGRQSLRAVVLQDGSEVDSVSRRVLVTRPGKGLLSGECEDSLAQTRPEGFGDSGPKIGGGAGASGDRFVLQPTPYPQWAMSADIPESGRYQLMITAKGDRAGGAYPSVGVSVGRPNPIRSATRLVHHQWHRMPVGLPIELEAGRCAIGLRFLNELNAGTRSNRDLYLDRWGLLRVEESDAAPVEASMMMMSGAGEGEYSAAPGFGLWVAFDRPLDGLEMNGRLRILGSANWSGPVDSPAPEIDLVIDQRVHATQQAAKPTFTIDRAGLGEGEHLVQLVATLPDGRQAATPVQRLIVPGPLAEVPAREITRFSVLNDRWGDSLADVLLNSGEEPRQRVAVPKEPLTASLELPEHLEGSFQLILEARGPGGTDKAHVRVRRRVGEEISEPLEIEVQHWWRDRPMGQIQLARGPKQLLVDLEPFPENNHLRVRSLSLESTERGDDRIPPQARILYPPPGHAAFGVDAVVVRAFDEDRLQAADLLIDGQLQSSYGYVPEGAGHVVLPMLLRDLEPGDHTLAVRVIDGAGNLGESESRTFTVAASASESSGTYARAVHLLNRLAFGPEPRELAKLLTLGEDAWLVGALREDGTGDRTAREWSQMNLGDALAYNAERLAVTGALRTDNPVRTRFVQWVDNHFSTWAGKIGMPAEWGDYDEHARLGFAPFGEQLLASTTNPSMLRYLDQSESFAGRLNENFARELLELHTVGVDGGYTQAEVTSLAQLLCGITVSQEAPTDGSGEYLRTILRSAPDLSDGTEQTLLGRRFEAARPSERFGRILQVLETLASHPQTAAFIAGKFAKHYVGSPAPQALTDDLTRVFLESGGDFREMLLAMTRHPGFWEARANPRLANPLDYGLRAARTMGYTQVDWSLCEFLRNSGMGLFDRATPDGYPDDDEAWADTNGLMQRWRWVQDIPWAVRALVPQEARRYYGGDPHEWRQRMVDLAAVRLTGHVLGDESNQVALDYLAEDEGPLPQRVDRMTLLVCRLPEANLK